MAEKSRRMGEREEEGEDVAVGAGVAAKEGCDASQPDAEVHS